jgi:hypothetical protein
MLLTWLLSAGIVVVILMTPTVLQTVYTSANHIAAGQQPGHRVPEPWLHRRRLADRLARARVRVRLRALLASSWTFYHSLPTILTGCSRCMP